jgi:hypothetical protein
MQVVASEITTHISPELQTIAKELERRNLAESIYSVLFSYVLDGLTWDQLRARKAIPTMEVTAQHPFWDGTFWATYPKRDGAPGTNSTGEDGITFLMTWTNAVLKQVVALENAPDLTATVAKAANGDCRGLQVEDKLHGRWELGRSDGSCRIPVVREDADDPMYTAGERIADKLVTAVLDKDVRSLLAPATAEQAHLIEAHELMWEVLDALIAKGVVRQPAVLRSGSADPGMLLPLVVVTVQKK